MLPSSLTLMPRPWYIVETDFPSRDCTDAWFSFGNSVTVNSLATARVLRNRDTEAMMRQWLDRKAGGCEGIFVDAEWRKLHHMRIHRSGDHINYSSLLHSCLRLRIVHPKSDQALRVDRTADRMELARLTRRVLDNDLRPPPKASEVMSMIPPRSFYYWCEVVQKLSPWITDWETLTGSIAATVRNIALLYADGRPCDWSCAERLLRDSINYTTTWVLEQACFRQAQSVRVADVWSKDSDRDCMRREIQRLVSEGILITVSRGRGKKTGAWKYRLAQSDIAEVIDRDKRILL